MNRIILHYKLIIFSISIWVCMSSAIQLNNDTERRAEPLYTINKIKKEGTIYIIEAQKKDSIYLILTKADPFYGIIQKKRN